MIILDTAYHITFDEHSSKPEIACTGNCRKAWWKSDFANKHISLCPLCGGSLCEAVEKVHYNVLSSANRPLRLSDFTSTTDVPHREKLSIKALLKGGAGINNLSVVKPAFVEKARAEWCS
ncbi:hypothetical protein [Rheinheimera hassiensis]|uniref:hypothetical protein n=1 Tax=Rheinheimera hassiensis TaxID=1193627 RepID=UPI001F06DFF9|nr:hypothetical protein [Rheinheimera hassiensis]